MAGVSILLPLACPAFAQQAGSGAESVEDIVVTAQRREEKLQDVPISITALSNAELRSTRVESSYDLMKVAPGLTVNRASGFAVSFLRGIGSSSIVPGDEPSVATYVDGFYQGPASSSVLPFNNVERVEVLKGPQGTLYGRNATGGLINIVTAEPQGELFVKGGVGYGNYGTIEGNAYLTGGLNDAVRGDLSIQFRNQRKGFQKNIVTGNSVSKDDNFAIRGKIDAQLTDDIILKLAADYSWVDNSYGNGGNIAPGTVPLASLLGGQYSYDPRNIYHSVDPLFLIKSYGATATLKADLGAVTIVSMTQYRRLKTKIRVDTDGTSADDAAFVIHPTLGRINSPTVSLNNRNNVPLFFTQEFQLLSNSDGPFSWITGLFGQISRTEANTLDSFIKVGGSPISSTFSRSKTKAYAGFAQGTYAFSDAFSLTLGARYSYEKRNASGQQRGATGAVVATTDKDADFKAFTYRAAADYRVSPELLFYASASKGFKSGAFNSNVINAAPAVDPETLYAYEIGWKSDPSRILRVNGSIYYYDYRDIQVTAQNANNLAQLQNAAAGELYGFELNTEARPARGLTLRAALALQHAEYTSFPAAQGFIPAPVAGNQQAFRDVGGSQIIRAPKFTSNIGAIYDLELDAGSELSFAGNFYYNSGYPFEVFDLVRQPAYSVFDGSITWTLPNARWSISAWSKNIANKKYATGLAQSASTTRLTYGLPRTFGLTLNWSM